MLHFRNRDGVRIKVAGTSSVN